MSLLRKGVNTVKNHVYPVVTNFAVNYGANAITGIPIRLGSRYIRHLTNSPYRLKKNAESIQHQFTPKNHKNYKAQRTILRPYVSVSRRFTPKSTLKNKSLNRSATHSAKRSIRRSIRRSNGITPRA